MFNDVAYKASGFLENGKPKSKFCNENRTHDARNTLVFVVKTSYQGNNFLSWRVGKSSSRQEENANQQMQDSLTSSFKWEFISRVNTV